MQVLYAHIFGVLLGQPETMWGVLGAALIACGVVSVSRAKSALPATGLPGPTAAKGPSAAERGHILYSPLAWQISHSAQGAAELAPAAPAGAFGNEGSIAALRHERQVPGWTSPLGMAPLKGGMLGGKRNSSSSDALTSSSPQWDGLELQKRSLSGVDHGPLASSSSAASMVVAAKPFNGPLEQVADVAVEGAAGHLLVGHIAQPGQGVSRQVRSGTDRGQTLRDREQSWTGEWMFEGKKVLDAPGSGARSYRDREREPV